MKEKSERYYLAIGLGQYIIEGHTKSEALEEFGITRGKFDRTLEYLEIYNYKLYILAKQKLDQNMYPRAQKICEFIVAGHTKAQASKEFSVSVSTIDKAVETIHEKNLNLYTKTKKQLMKNIPKASTAPSSIPI